MSGTRQREAEMRTGAGLRLGVVVVALAITHSVEHVGAKRAFAGSILQSRCVPVRGPIRMPDRPPGRCSGPTVARKLDVSGDISCS